MSDNNAGTLGGIAIQLSRFFGPARDMLLSGQLVQLFAELGMVFPPQLETDPSFASAVNSALTPLLTLPRTVTQIVSELEAKDYGDAIQNTVQLGQQIASSVSAFESLSSALATTGAGLPGVNPGDVATFTADLAGRLFDWSAVTYVEEAAPELATLLDLFGVIERSEQAVGSTDPAHPQFTKKTLHLDKLAQAVFTPSSALQDLYGFGNSNFDGSALFARIASALSYAGLPVLFDPTVTPAQLDLVQGVMSVDHSVSPPGLALMLRTLFSEQAQVTIAPVTLTGALSVSPIGATISVQPNLSMRLTAPASSMTTGQLTLGFAMTQPDTPLLLVGDPQSSRLEISSITGNVGVTFTWNPSQSAALGAFTAGSSLKGIHLFIAPSIGDGFLTSILPSNGIDSTFDLGFQLTPSGFSLTGSASLQVDLPLHLDLGVVQIDDLTLGIGLGSGGIRVPLGANVRGTLGPVEAVVQGIGVEADITVGSGGNLGPANVDVHFLPPTGIGVSIDAGPVSGGGFLFIGEHRYAGAAELSVYGIAVKAFGLIETVLPDGSPGYSFVIVISAEFTPIQLGFGFTLIGVGGLVGINRTINGDALEKAVIGGSIANILFPKDVVHDAPALVNDLATFFPAAQSHYLFGPMAELGWGTPALITGKLGIILELPGPRLSLLGLVQMALPTADSALVSINLAIGGLLDFPGKLFWFEAALFNSQVVSFPIQGGMAFRLTWSDSPSFALAVGGFNPAFTPPQGFPDVKRCSIDIGINGNPSLTIQGYFAVTSNSAQVGSSIDLRASGAGIDLHGYLGFDALFIFSPFSFEADFSAGVDISFAGAGFGINLHGKISGPTPYRVQAQACVSVLFWDACLPIDFSFGSNSRPSLPQVDPWIGISGGNNPVEGLQDAINASTNWSGSFPSGAHPVVTLTQADANAASPPIDPVGQATLHQKVCPLDLKLTKFGIYQPIGHTIFQMVAITVHNDATGKDDSIAAPTPVQDQFAPALFTTLSDSDKLKSPSYELFDSGFTIQPEQVTTESSPPSLAIAYETDLIDDQGNDFPQPDFQLTMRHLTAMLGRSAAARNGIRRAGVQRFVDPTAPVKVTLASELFVVANACSLAANNALAPTPVAFRAAQNQLDDHLASQPSDLATFRVVPSYLAA